jgi:tRNA-specific 2-thiouridylase
MKTHQTVYVGLSGGVDSSVAALRLKKAGHTVVGVFIKVWHPDFMVCNWEQERLDAMRVAAHLDIPFLTCDAEAEYRDEVAHYFIEEYKTGRTPNPDVMCNQEVKFGAFLRFARERGADFIATGHYAQKIETQTGFELHRGVDTNKDQTYFLWTLSTEQLAQSLFPVGDTSKDEIRAQAQAAGIPTATKKDSQGICFLGHVDIADFLSHYIELVPGDVLDEHGDVIGTHKGALVYTSGQRHGFTLHTTNNQRDALFVIQRNLPNNTITVGDKSQLVGSNARINLNQVVMRSALDVGESVELQFRYRQIPLRATVTKIASESATMSVQVEEESEVPASGQSCVLYQDSHCLGGGIIA